MQIKFSRSLLSHNFHFVQLIYVFLTHLLQSIAICKINIRLIIFCLPSFFHFSPTLFLSVLPRSLSFFHFPLSLSLSFFLSFLPLSLFLSFLPPLSFFHFSPTLFLSVLPRSLSFFHFPPSLSLSLSFFHFSPSLSFFHFSPLSLSFISPPLSLSLPLFLKPAYIYRLCIYFPNSTTTRRI